MKASQRVPDFASWLPQIRDWFQTDLGRQMLEREQKIVDEMMTSVFGYHLLQVGLLPNKALYGKAEASHKFMMLPDVSHEGNESILVGAADVLPLASECIDAVILHHALDFSEQPHQVLREASRVLRPGGKLLIIGFNPSSLWGFYRALVKNRKPVPWGAWFIRHRRLSDWLTLLELKEEQHQGGFYRPPLASEGWMRRLHWLESLGNKYLNHNGGFYVFLATKETFSMTPINSSWRRRLTMPLIPRPAQQAGRSSAKGEVAMRREKDSQRGELFLFPQTRTIRPECPD